MMGCQSNNKLAGMSQGLEFMDSIIALSRFSPHLTVVLVLGTRTSLLRQHQAAGGGDEQDRGARHPEASSPHSRAG